MSISPRGAFLAGHNEDVINDSTAAEKAKKVLC